MNTVQNIGYLCPLQLSSIAQPKLLEPWSLFLACLSVFVGCVLSFGAWALEDDPPGLD
jgi:hypothetical protein